MSDGRHDPDTLEAQCHGLLRAIRWLAHAQWRRDQAACDLAEYLDAGHEALQRCLSRYDPARGVPFETYAVPRIQGAIRDARQAYATWRHARPVGRPGRAHADAVCPRAQTMAPWEEAYDLARGLHYLPPSLQPITEGLLRGETYAEVAARLGVTPQAIKLRLWRWRQRQSEEGL